MTKPLQHQRGWVEFYKLRFKVTPDVLIPRPETELLVDEVLNFASHFPLSPSPFILLDIGTGAGNIAISLCVHLPVVRIIATDISEKALRVAKLNAKYHGVSDKIKFVQSDLLSALEFTLPALPLGEAASSAYTLVIVTNLPYIPTERIPYLDQSVKDYEPHLALDGGKDGFDLYRKFFHQIRQQPRRLQAKLKLIIGEIDYTHGELAVSEAQKYFPEAEVEVKTDLAQKQRILLIRF